MSTAGDAGVLCFLTQPPLFQDPIKGLGCASLKKKKNVLQARPNLRYILCCWETRSGCTSCSFWESEFKVSRPKHTLSLCLSFAWGWDIRLRKPLLSKQAQQPGSTASRVAPGSHCREGPPKIRWWLLPRELKEEEGGSVGGVLP